MSGYNGWSNYETWRTNLEFAEGLDPAEFLADHLLDVADDRDAAVDSLATWLCDMAHELVEEQSTGWAYDLATSFLSHVDWHEIAEHYVDDYIAELDA